ncbi:MAG: hypothetical protein LBE56_01105 [Tannerella sp.]|jgi:hypothetical protein|nr:hypothetical protein [Tannerella sp.]
MKKILFLCMLLLPCLMMAQERQVIEASTSEDITNKVSEQIQYLFPEFTDGVVLFKNAPKSGGKLNYNMLVGEMQFLENNNEVMTFDVGDVASVTINGRTFYPYKGNEYAEELLSTDVGELRVRRKGNVAPYAKKGAYGTSSSASSITSYSSVTSGGQQYGLTVANDVLISVRYFYYLVGSNGKYAQITNVKSFTKQFPAYRAQIEAFVKENNTRFDKEDDLKKLLLYCAGLSN